MLPTRAPYPYFTDLEGDPLDDGSIYYGVANANPVTVPLPIFWDEEGLQPAAQPVKTRNGLPVRSGTPANVYTGLPYSISVYDRLGRLVYYSASNTGEDVTNAGQCRLAKVGGNLVLNRFKGNALMIGGVAQRIPAAGVSLAPNGLSAGTTYYIYAFMDIGVMKLEASTTSWATDASTGMRVKNGDPSRTLVGMARPIVGPAFQDSVQQRFVLSWFNQKPIFGSVAFAGGSIPNTLYVELSSSARIEFLCWEGGPVESKYNATVSNNTLGQTTYFSTSLDSATVNTTPEVSYKAYANDASGSIGNSWNLTVGEGYHYLTCLGKVSGATGSYPAFYHQAVIQG